MKPITSRNGITVTAVHVAAEHKGILENWDSWCQGGQIQTSGVIQITPENAKEYKFLKKFCEIYGICSGFVVFTPLSPAAGSFDLNRFFKVNAKNPKVNVFTVPI